MAPEKRVAIVGAGNWGSVAAMIIARNCARLPDFEDEVRMWVYEENIHGRKLTDIINTDHENVKYLPGRKLPANLVAVPDLLDATEGANVLVFVLPHQFLPRTCNTLKGTLPADCIAISLIKGIDFDAQGVVLMTDIIEKHLGVDCSVLSGANIANEIADGKFCESTVGYSVPENGLVFYKLFNEPHFRISLVRDVAGPQVFGGLKNVMALGSGFCDSMDMGSNAKAALMRIGMIEMQRFANLYFDGIAPSTINESCGMADLITSCLGGRNRRVSEAFGRAQGGAGASWQHLEAKLLDGQKLQGTGTCQEVMKILKRDNRVEHFPFIKLIHKIAYEGAPVASIIEFPHNNITLSML